MATGIVYKLTNMLTGKIYVGKTRVGVAVRWSQHKHTVRNNPKTYLHRAIRKYGEENFFVEVLEQGLSKDELNAKEIEWIAKLDSTNPLKGYNVTTGGDGGNHTFMSRMRPPTAETINKRRKSVQETCQKRSPEQRKAIGDKLKSLWTDEKRAQCSEANRKFWDSEEGKQAIEAFKTRRTKWRTCEYCQAVLNGRDWQRHTRPKCPNGAAWPPLPRREYISPWRGKKMPREMVEKIATATRASWTLEKRAAWGERMSREQFSPERNNNLRQAVQAAKEKRWTPEKRARMGELAKQRYADPIYREEQARKRKAWWDAHPEVKERFRRQEWTLEMREQASKHSLRYWHSKTEAK